MVLVSDSEMEAAKRQVSSRRLYVLENGIDVSALPTTIRQTRRPQIGTAGRLTYAKAPWKFAALARSVAETADVHWIGGGSATDLDSWISDAPLGITGWLDEEEALRRIASLDVYVSTSLWEGLPIAVLQAQALGIPCVVSDCIGNIDIVKHGVTGYIAESDAVLEGYVRALIGDSSLRLRLGENASKMARIRFDSRLLGTSSFAIYSQFVAAQ